MGQIPYEEKSKIDLVKNKQFENLPEMVKETVMQGADNLKSENELGRLADNMTETK